MLLLVSLLTCLTAAASIEKQYGHQIHGERVKNPAWVKHSAKPHPETVVPVKIALAQRNLEKGVQWLDEVSNPSSEKYGQHWTAEEVVEAFRPQ